MDKMLFDAMARALPPVAFAAAPDVGILLGSGWGEALEKEEVLCRVPYSDIPGLGASTVAGHAGEFVLYRQSGRLVAAWCGRRHYYEGVGWEAVVAPIEMLRRMGCRTVLLTNAAGGVNTELRAGDFVVLSDHVNRLGLSPLMGAHDPAWGPRSPDMSEIYTPELREKLLDAARAAGASARTGVYACNSGPQYETPAEVRLLATCGIDAVGMSTVPEAIFAASCGFRVAGLSLISNAAAGISPHPLSHAEVVAAGEAAKPKMKALIGAFLDRL